jgi:hypothetical protein
MGRACKLVDRKPMLIKDIRRQSVRAEYSPSFIKFGIAAV